MSAADTNPEYWSAYSNLQRVKHEIIKQYLKGWFPKMILGPGGCKRLLFIDTHAGRGRHLHGELGSPLVALNALLEHKWRDKLLSQTEVHFYFVERDDNNVNALRQELANVPLPTHVSAVADTGDCFAIIQGAIDKLESKGGSMAPSFLFVDPYGFKLPGKLLHKLLSYPKVELFVNVIWRELDMAMQQFHAVPKPKPPSKAGLFSSEGDAEDVDRSRSPTDKASLEATLNSVFDGDGWRKITAVEADDRADACAELFRQVTGARWGTTFRMIDNGRIRYFLLHLTNHDAGRDLIKDSMWQVCPDGGFSASKSDHPKQVVLIQSVPDLSPIRAWVGEQLADGPKRWQDLGTAFREELWLDKHLNEVLREMRTEREIEAEGKFVRTENPLLRLSLYQRQAELW
jgi:three-Cys-motif partner protein